ncbi:unnamed protein product, partial [Iphiclides podalirius]
MNTGTESHSVDKNKWGYIVCSGVVITFIAGIGHVNSFGLIYNDFIVDTNSTVRSLTMSHGVFAVMLALGGLILNIIFKKHSMRVGGFIGAAVFSTGSVLTVFITNTNQLPLTFGALQGIGFGMMAPVCYSTLNYYYIRKRTQVMSVIKAVQGFILMWYPQLIKILMTYYGFRGTLLIISGVSLHTFPGMAVMWKNEHVKRNNRIAKDNVVKVEENVDLLSIEDGKQTLDATKSGILVVHKSKAQKFWEELWRLLNIKVLKDPVFCNICIGQSFVNFSDLTFFVLQPMLLFQYGYSTTEVAASISISTGADVAGRCILAVMSSMMSVNTRVLYYVATLFTFLIRIVLLHVRRKSFVFVVTGALGVLRGWLHVASPLVISNQVSHEDFPGAYALSLLASGLVNVTFAPFIGLVKDINGDYVPAFYALVACCLPCLMFWPLECKLLKR